MKSLVYLANVRMPTEKAHGIQIMKTCESLAVRGLRVVLVVPERKNSHKETPFNFYNVEENFSIIRSWCIDFIGSPVCKKFFYNLETYTFYHSVKAFTKKESFDIFFTRDLYLALKFSKFNKNVFFEIHSLPDKPTNKYKKTWKQVKGIVVISQGIKDDLIKFGVDEKKITIARDAVDIGKFSVKEEKLESRKRLGLPKDKNIALYAGHLYGWKGAHIFAQAADKLPNTEFYVVGGTEGDLVKFKKKYNYKNLHYAGWQRHDKIPVWLNAVNVLVLPNCGSEKITTHYTSPMKMFEYMASGTPIVASDLPSIREVLSKRNALLVKAGGVEGLAEGIEKILTDVPLSHKLAKQAKKDVTDFSWEGRLNETIKHIII
ncbi:MAG: glycosyltransferase family 4 protein [Candidatus Magasanikbacteria bacterium]|jgi:glycosyltransferase involved in cell wall biosynthesis|nr:glycosyltransferase family 4 protein [Candidatus Magasanikbacteria bacterium]